jgi:hypothetical protein
MAINIAGMLGAVRRLLGYQVTIGELIVVAHLGSIVSWPVVLIADFYMT